MDYPEVTLDITTGRRFSFFRETMNTFVENCEDTDLIKEVMICDDRSSDVDKDKMKKMCVYHHLPEVKLYNNTLYGQLNSLQILFDRITTEWVVHIEDDWRFLIKDNFIRKSFDIINSDDRIKEVTFRFWECMYVKDGENEYRMHVFSPMNYKTDWDIIKYNDCTYWGLSFNPALMHVPTVRKCLENIQQHSPENRGWDKEVSKKYWEMGYKRANLNDVYVWHIGGKNSFYTRNK